MEKKKAPRPSDSQKITLLVFCPSDIILSGILQGPRGRPGPGDPEHREEHHRVVHRFDQEAQAPGHPLRPHGSPAQPAGDLQGHPRDLQDPGPLGAPPARQHPGPRGDRQPHQRRGPRLLRPQRRLDPAARGGPRHPQGRDLAAPRQDVQHHGPHHLRRRPGPQGEDPRPAHPDRVPGPAPHRPGQEQRRDRRAHVHQQEHRPLAYQEHLRQARHPQPPSAGALRHQFGPVLGSGIEDAMTKKAAPKKKTARPCPTSWRSTAAASGGSTSPWTP
ncbi:MAG: hypothetical protein MZU95_01810 [Desulfomicrobium escambiense]|nr:hypothetical protein [Desulfomicrobium escambiense]